eukprot:TRINITY_DN7487_c0_g1_i1.p2 TRINITY_DN7487_c0_g1~~TRINITY_DN7487_c0_g1_i1.p2  ORF type:complete len:113 (-),score=14.20 TRINITY_DN7487_c0_g1_i1:60-398(-)
MGAICSKENPKKKDTSGKRESREVYQAIQMKTEQPSPKHNFGILEEESAKIPSQADSGKPASSLSNWLIDQHKVSLNWYGESKSMSDVEGLLAKIESQGSGRRQPNLSLIHI